MNAPKCDKCRKADATVRADVESPRECQSAEMNLCDECVELADGLGCYVEALLTYSVPVPCAHEYIEAINYGQERGNVECRKCGALWLAAK